MRNISQYRYQIRNKHVRANFDETGKIRYNYALHVMWVENILPKR